jgi:hypothetical protein
MSTSGLLFERSDMSTSGLLFERSDMSTSGLLFQLITHKNIQLSVLISYTIS